MQRFPCCKLWTECKSKKKCVSEMKKRIHCYNYPKGFGWERWKFDIEPILKKMVRDGKKMKKILRKMSRGEIK